MTNKGVVSPQTIVARKPQDENWENKSCTQNKRTDLAVVRARSPQLQTDQRPKALPCLTSRRPRTAMGHRSTG